MSSRGGIGMCRVATALQAVQSSCARARVAEAVAGRLKKKHRVKYLAVHKFPRGLKMIVVTVKVDWGQETIQEILPELNLKDGDQLESPCFTCSGPFQSSLRHKK